MNLSFYTINKQQTNIIKGVAISILVFHNFIHMTNNIGENEFTFDSLRIYNLFDAIITDPSFILNGLITCFGYFGIEPFIFISAYGLTKMFMKERTTYKNYLLKRLAKLYSLLIFGLILYTIFFTQMLDDNVGFNFRGISIMYLSILSTLNNLTGDRIFKYPGLGPWWYFALAVQLYLIFPFLYSLFEKYKKQAFWCVLTIVYILTYALLPLAEKYDVPFYGNILGHLPEFLLGIALAKFKDFQLNWKVIIFALLIFVVSNVSEYFHPFSFLSATILILAALYPIINCEKGWITRPLTYLGTISMFMFISNGPLRFRTSIGLPYSTPFEALFAACMHFAIVVVISILMSILYKKTFSPLLQKFLSRINS